MKQYSTATIDVTGEVGYWGLPNEEREPQQALDPITEGWASTCIARPPCVEFLSNMLRDPTSDQCDVDTIEGSILPPVAYPKTYKTQSSGPCDDMRDANWRQDNMTSELWILKELRRRRVMAENIRNQLQEAQLQLVPVKEEPWPAAECLIRPATPDDFEGIANIINKERLQDLPQLLEPSQISPSAIRTIYENCQRGLRPFIVAVPTENQFFDRSKWPEGADKEYEEFVKFKKSIQKLSDAKTILGFSFVSNARTGIFGTPCYGSRFAGRITLLVHPDHRQNAYGSALLDRILLSVAIYHRSLIDYKWDCPNPAGVYEQPVIKNQRKYSRLYIEALMSDKYDLKYTWTNKMLEKFGFEQVGRFNEAAQSSINGDKVGLDVVFWEFQARPVEEITE